MITALDDNHAPSQFTLEFLTAKHQMLLARGGQLALLLSPLLPPGRHALAPPARMLAAPKRGGVVDTYQTVSVLCAKCNERLFRYKKKNGMKSNLVKCYVERISEDSAGLLAAQAEVERGGAADGVEWACPSCGSRFVCAHGAD